jgi:hypothetical protein
MKTIISLLLLIILLTACAADNDRLAPDAMQSSASSSEPEAPSGPGAQEISESSMESSSPEMSESTPPPAPEVSEQNYTESVNSALSLIPGSDRLLESEQGIFLLKEYGFDMAWMEANAIENLDRGTEALQLPQNQMTYTYFLLLPKYVGSTVVVQALDWNGTEFAPTKTLYQNESAPDNYGLVLTSTEPEASASLRVTVTYGGVESSYTFSYDGRGDRPQIQVLPGDERWHETMPRQWRVESPRGDVGVIVMDIPIDWEIREDGLTIFTVNLSREDGRAASYRIWFGGISELSPEEYLAPMDDGVGGEILLNDGLVCSWVMSADSPTAYHYALEVDGVTVTLMTNVSENVSDYPEPDGSYRAAFGAPHEFIPGFQDSLQSIQVLERGQ